MCVCVCVPSSADGCWASVFSLGEGKCSKRLNGRGFEFALARIRLRYCVPRKRTK